MGKTESKNQSNDNDGFINNNNQIELVQNIEEDTDKSSILLIIIVVLIIIQMIYKLYRDKVSSIKIKYENKQQLV